MNNSSEKEAAFDTQSRRVFENQLADVSASANSITSEAGRDERSRIRPETHQPRSGESSGLALRPASAFSGGRARMPPERCSTSRMRGGVLPQ